MKAEICHHLPWDSQFFGLRIARIIPTRLTPETAGRARDWCAMEGVDCLYFLADSDDPATVRTAEDHGFRLVDLRLTLTVSLPRGPATAAWPGQVRLFNEQDIPALRALARVSHHDSRFYTDTHFPRQLCDELYETWIDKSCHGYADAVFVAELGSGPVGYATVRRDSEVEGVLGLIAVTPDAQGMGLGQTLMAAVLAWCRCAGLPSLRVVTQGRNCRAQRMYGRCGFLPRSLQLWYHCWFGDQNTRRTQ